MVYFQNFRLNVVIRIMLIVSLIFLINKTFEVERFFITPILLSVLLVVLFVNLLHYIEKLNREVTGFLETIRYSDFSQHYEITGQGTAYDDLKKAFNSVIEDFKKIRKEKEAHYFYLQNVVRQLDVGIVAFDENGDIELINDAAKQFLNIQSLENIALLAYNFQELERNFAEIQSGERKMVKIHREEDIQQVLLFASEFAVEQRNIKLVSFKNIQEELDEKEMDSWQKLIRVLTHEIMNSIAPISSLTSTANLMVNDVYAQIKDHLPKDFDQEQIEDIQQALETIHKRSDGLIHFVETYRNLTRIPKPNFAIFPIVRLLNSIQLLLEEEIKANNIDYSLDIESQELEITADEQLIEQVIINILKNAIYALAASEERKIRVSAYRNANQRIIVEIHDTGQGILPEVLDKIFIPFFTTKPTGSGIGLSLSKQIMRLHGGSISVKSTPDVETTFILSFP